MYNRHTFNHHRGGRFGFAPSVGHHHLVSAGRLARYLPYRHRGRRLGHGHSANRRFLVRNVFAVVEPPDLQLGRASEVHVQRDARVFFRDHRLQGLDDRRRLIRGFWYLLDDLVYIRKINDTKLLVIVA